MQWLELPNGTLCELTGSYARVRRSTVRRVLTRFPNDFQIILSGGSVITGIGEEYVALLEESDAEELMLDSNLGLDLIKAISKLSGLPVITAPRLAQTAYEIAQQRRAISGSQATSTVAHGSD